MESDIELIKAIKQNPALYDPSNRDFKYMMRKEEIWQDVANYLGITVADLKRRWTCLRDKYTRELKQRRLEILKTEPSTFFGTMDFLRQFVRKRSERKSIVCNIKKEVHIKKEIMNDKDYETGWSEEYQDDSRMENSLVDNEPYIQLPEGGNEEEGRPPSNYGCETYEEYHLEDEEEEPQMPQSKQPKREIQIMSPNTTVVVNPLEVPMTSIPITTATINAPPPSVPSSSTNLPSTSMEDEFFCRSVSCCLANLQRINKIKAKVEIFQILEKYVEIEESSK
ncbi:hypothetical protein ACFFRR_008385 [Megaselia abdita]